MKEPASYVIRIYRRDADGFAGIVEDVASGRAAAFRTLAELCELLAGRRRFVKSRSPKSPMRAPAPGAGAR